MRIAIPLAAFLALSCTTGVMRASSIDSAPPNQQSIDALLMKANQAQPRDQCFLYAEVVHQMTELSIRQYAAGDTAKAAGLLKQIQQFAQRIHWSLASKDKRLKNAEILLSHTAFRLTEMLHATSDDDQALVKQTLAQVNQAQNAAMMQVFSK
jgi:hypothetical protein